MSRTSKDTACNNFGLSLIDLCCTFNINIFNGRLFNDKNGEYTYFANNGASVVDYMLASSNIFPNVTDFNVDNNMFSVHCPLYCTFGSSRNTTVTNLTQSENHDDGRIHYYEKMIWNASTMQIFDL